MAHITVQQPNGKYAIYSTISNGFLFEDCDEDELVACYVSMAREDIIFRVENAIEKIKSGKVNFTYEDALKSIKNFKDSE